MWRSSAPADALCVICGAMDVHNKEVENLRQEQTNPTVNSGKNYR